MKLNYFFIIIIGLLINSSFVAQTITGTEAVEYDPIGNRFLITNGSTILQQASGSSTLSYFGTGGAGYGMEVIDNTLYAITGGGNQFVKGYDLTTEEEIFSISVTGSGFLNGMASDPANDRIWITDFSNNTVIEFDVSDPSTVAGTNIVPNTGCTPNGITYDEDNNRLVFACWSGGEIKSVDLMDHSVEVLTNAEVSNIDGIDHDNNGNFYISSWSPVSRISKLSSEFTTIETITAPGLSNPADISYAVEIDTLAIANSGNNTITYIGFDIGVGVSEITNTRDLNVYPNPVTNESYIQFELDEPNFCDLTIIDQNGKKVFDLLHENMTIGTHKVLLSGVKLSPGLYFCEMIIDHKSNIIKLVVN